MTDKQIKSTENNERDVIEVDSTTYVEATPASKRYSSSKSNSTKPSSSAAKPAKTGLLWLVSTINFLLIVCAVGAGYWFWLNWQADKQQQQSYFASQDAVLASQTSANNALRSELSQQQQTINNQLQAIASSVANAEQQADANRRNLADVSGRRPSDWLIAEADYLVRMAGRKLWLERDVKTAMLMLQSADSRLEDLADPSLFPIRQAIANDIQTLKQVNNVSLTSVALAVSGMVQQVGNLPLALPKLNLEPEQQEPKEGFDRLIEFFRTSFQYQPNNQPITPVLSQQQQWLAREQLKFALLQAQSAVLQEQPTLFIQSLQRSIGLLVDHYDLDDPSVSQFVSGLKNLESTKIDRVYPSQFAAAQPLNDLLNSRMNSVSTSEALQL